MNAGAYDGEMKQVVRSVRLLMPDGQIRICTGPEMEFGYRTSILRRIPAVALEAELELSPGDPAAIGARIAELDRQRREKQPLSLPSAGSTFKRPEGHFAGALIEGCGLKGCTIGGAQVSQLHAGFLVNTGGATAGDVEALMRHVQDVVYRETGVHLEPEVKRLEELVCIF
jgi:UDP-N-acetylmuramate dehydrogenase